MKMVEIKNILGEILVPKKWEPIGTIKMYACEMDMSKLYYGTWELTLQERSPIGINPGSSEIRFKTSGSQFGEKNHTLSVNEMPSGTEVLKYVGSSRNAWGLYVNNTNYINEGTGQGIAHNNIHPVEVVYFYKRIA